MSRRSPIWQFFTVAGDSNQYGKCNKCFTNVTRGGSSSKSFITTNLVSHLHSKHLELEEYNRLKDVSKEEKDEEILASSSSTNSNSSHYTKLPIVHAFGQ